VGRVHGRSPIGAGRALECAGGRAQVVAAGRARVSPAPP
jgi:hypothetical protein